MERHLEKELWLRVRVTVHWRPQGRGWLSFSHWPTRRQRGKGSVCASQGRQEGGEGTRRSGRAKRSYRAQGHVWLRVGFKSWLCHFWDTAKHPVMQRAAKNYPDPNVKSAESRNPALWDGRAMRKGEPGSLSDHVEQSCPSAWTSHTWLAWVI